MYFHEFVDLVQEASSADLLPKRCGGITFLAGGERAKKRTDSIAVCRLNTFMHVLVSSRGWINPFCFPPLSPFCDLG